MDLDSTIVAISSPSGTSARALVRVTGEDVHDHVRKLGLKTKTRTLSPCSLQLPEGVLPVLCISFASNGSYTGQETIEIMLPNNQYLIDSLLAELIRVTSGRHAEAGEFTARAFLNGNISLSQAEGVCATISANNDGELRGATLLREGALHKQVLIISSRIKNTLALVESGIDFTDEEDVVAIGDEDLLDSITSCIEIIGSILSGKISMATLSLLPKVVIAGLPNSGKSTLFNALVGHTRVVVSKTAGTTRDAIQEPVKFGSKEAMLIDIAGLENVTDTLSEQAQQVALQTMEDADVIVHCVAPEDSPPALDEHAIIVYTKSDLRESTPERSVCADNGDGLQSLKVEIEQRLSSRPLASEDALALLPRHEHYLQQALTSLKDAKMRYKTPELVAASLRESLDCIGTISGDVTPDEVIGEIFSSFCVGK